jgi:CBS domain containing-hemolysin-like protein
MIADWAENYVELLMLETYLNSNSISETLVSLGSGINSFKWVLSSLTYLIILFGIIITLKIFLRKFKRS